MRQATAHVNTGEPCFSLWEENVGGRRIQRLVVVRNDELADFVHDIGPAVPAPKTEIIGGFREPNGKLDIVETVGSLQQWAERERTKDFRNESIALPNLIDGYARLKEIGPTNPS